LPIGTSADVAVRGWPRPSAERTQVDFAIAADSEIAALDDEDLIEAIAELKDRKGAVLLAHNYQIPPIQDLADFVGDSLQLSQQAAAADTDLIVFCGVHFMAETAAILCPEKRVLIPDPEAACSLAATVTAEQVRTWRDEHPEGVVVSYVNTDADVKAESDYCCTSSNAVQVVQSLPASADVLFLPDMFLGLYIERRSGRKLHLWLGECHVHAGIRSEDIGDLLDEYPEAHLLLHPECGCVSQCLYALGEGDLPADRTSVLSTGGMVRHARGCQGGPDFVGTEVGLLYRLRTENPDKEFRPLREDAICEYMKTITLPKLYRSLRDGVELVTVPEDIAERARRAIDRMMAVPAG
jgi:quinolinate synthase